MNSKTKKITTIGMLCAITYVTMAVGRIPVVLFLKYDPSDVIVTLGGLIWGPMTSCILRSLADSDAFQSGRCAEHNGRPETLAIIN